MVEPQNEISIPAEIDAVKKLSIEMIVAYLDEKLPYFPIFFKEKYPTTAKLESESIISQVLCSYLETFRKPDEVSLFHFQPEWKNSRYAVDFAVIDVNSFMNSPKKPKPIFTMEAKRLPAPKKTKSDHSRKKEYVKGNSGGIERYKRGKHGKGLPQSAIIGYIQVNDCSYWHKFINKWIQQLISYNTDTTINWDSKDKLVSKISFSKTQKFLSDNSRNVGAKKVSIRLWHYLIELN